MEPTRTYLEKHDPKYHKVSTLFHKSSSTREFSLYILNIEEVENLNLKRRFKSKEKEYRKKYGFVNIIQVYHGTKKSNISSILKNNLDVNRHGLNRGHRFGAGVSFSAFAFYSSHYCEKSDGHMLLCDVLVSHIIEVPENKHSTYLEPPFIEGSYPPLRYDTTAKNKTSMDVIVKFENHTFYPAFVIHFKKISKLITLPSPRIDDSISNLPGTSSNYSPQLRHQSVSQFSRSSVPSTKKVASQNACGLERPARNSSTIEHCRVQQERSYVYSRNQQSVSQFSTSSVPSTKKVASQNVWGWVERPARKSLTIEHCRVQQERSYVYSRNQNSYGWHSSRENHVASARWYPTVQPEEPSDGFWSWSRVLFLMVASVYVYRALTKR